LYLAYQICQLDLARRRIIINTDKVNSRRPTRPRRPAHQHKTAMQQTHLRALLGAALLLVPALAAATTDAEHGKEVFTPCVACHGPSGQNGEVGPSLKGIVGRKAASIEDFLYSAALRRSGLIWDEANLRAYLTDPQAVVRGNRMAFPGVKDPADLDDLVAYLKTLR
jgi:cytochrome c